jgi:hypothetical protein
MRRRGLGLRDRRRSDGVPALAPLDAIDRTGAVTRTDGTVLRILRVAPLDPHLLDGGRRTELADGFGELLDALEPEPACQVYVERPEGDDAGGRFHLVVPTAPAGRRRDGSRRSLERAERVRRSLCRSDLAPVLLDGPAVARLLTRRFDPAAAAETERQVELLGDTGEAPDTARGVAADLRRELARVTPSPGPRHVAIGDELEQVLALAPPADAGFGWFARLVDQREVGTVSLHVARPEPPATRCSIQLVVRERAGAAALAERADRVAAQVGDATGGAVQRGEFRQAALWGATLPLALDAPDAGDVVAPDALAAGFPFLGAGTGSPVGVPLGSDPAGTRLERFDPFDPALPRAGLLVTGAHAPAVALALLRELIDVEMLGAVVDPLERLGDAVSAGPDAQPRMVAPGDGTSPLDQARAGLAWLAERHRVTGAGGALLVVGAAVAGDAAGARWIRRAIWDARAQGVCLIVADDEPATGLDSVVRAFPQRLALEKTAGGLQGRWRNGARGERLVLVPAPTDLDPARRGRADLQPRRVT